MVGLELARRESRTLNIDKLSASGYGSTSNSCAIIRVHYSTLDATALACEGYYDWKEWEARPGAGDERGLAVFHDTSCLVMKTKHNGWLERICGHLETLGFPFEHWDAYAIRAHLSVYDHKSF